MYALGAPRLALRKDRDAPGVHGVNQMIRTPVLPKALDKLRCPSLSLRLQDYLRVPTTRVHVGLLGPCFKTGRISTQSLSAADRCMEQCKNMLPTMTTARWPNRSSCTPQTIDHLQHAYTPTKWRSTTIMSYRHLIGWGFRGLETQVPQVCHPDP